jgi:hypothetical protein
MSAEPEYSDLTRDRRINPALARWRYITYKQMKEQDGTHFKRDQFHKIPASLELHSFNLGLELL